MTRAAVVSVAHGGGPMPVLGDPGHKDIIKSLKTHVPKILRLHTQDAPRAIVVVTAHWSTSQPTISAASHHRLYYDYGGFPREAYELKYPAPGSPEVAEEVKQALERGGFAPILDKSRGWDHGVFVPFLLINPEANIPIVQVSVLASEDPAAHLRMGRALASLRDSNIAIVGSGSASFHNLRTLQRMYMGQVSAAGLRTKSEAWNAALTDALIGEVANDDERDKKLEQWRKFPNADDMHPATAGEHFMPLLVCAGARGETKGQAFKDTLFGVDNFTYYWSDAPVNT